MILCPLTKQHIDIQESHSYCFICCRSAASSGKIIVRAALQPWAVRLPQWEDAMYPNVLAV